MTLKKRTFITMVWIAATVGWSATAVAVDTASAPALSVNTTDQNKTFATTFSTVNNWIDRKAFPGAVLAIGQHGHLIALKAFGRQAFSPDAAEMTTNAIFDLASVTKVTATTTAIEILYDRNMLDLGAPVVQYLPSFGAGKGHDDVLVRNLLTHSSGLYSTDLLWSKVKDRAGLLELINTMPMSWKPGTHFQYRDENMILLGEIVRRVSGQPLDVFLTRNAFQPLGMKDTGFNPSHALIDRIPPTEQDNIFRHELVHGVVHDENAYRMGGVAGHAGLFSTAIDLSHLAQMYLNKGTYAGYRLLKPETVALFMRRENLPVGNTYAFGWDTPGSFARFAGQKASPHAILHTGFTGTSIYIDPDRDAFIILLTNRVNPSRENQLIKDARIDIHTAALTTLDQAAAP